MTKEDTTAIAVPAPMAWPLVLAMGVTLMFAGLLMNVSVTALGAVLTIAGCVGWFREVVPRDHEEEVPLVAEDDEIRTERRVVDRLAIAPEQVRAWLPIHTYPVASIAGGAFCPAPSWGAGSPASTGCCDAGATGTAVCCRATTGPSTAAIRSRHR